MTSRVIIAIGIVLMAISLAVRSDDALLVVAAITSWLGVILVIVGSGRMLFLER